MFQGLDDELRRSPGRISALGGRVLRYAGAILGTAVIFNAVNFLILLD